MGWPSLFSSKICRGWTVTWRTNESKRNLWGEFRLGCDRCEGVCVQGLETHHNYSNANDHGAIGLAIRLGHKIM